MKIPPVFIAAFFFILACNKRNNTPKISPAPDDSVQQAITDTPKIKGIDTVILLNNYDCISIPLTIYSNNGTTENITLSLPDDMPIRMKAELSTVTGTTPFNTNLKIYTYFTAGTWSFPKGMYSNIKILAKKSSGASFAFTYPYDITIKYCTEMFYAFYLKSPELNTIAESTYTKVATGPKFNWDAATNQLYLTELFLGTYNGKTYKSVDNQANQIKQKKQTFDCYLNNLSFVDTILGYSATDTTVFYLNAHLDFYRIYENDASTYRLRYSVNPAFDTTIFAQYHAVGNYIF